LNSAGISGTTSITESDIIGVGHALLQLQGDRLATYIDGGDNTFEVRGLTVTTGDGRALLQPVTFALLPRTMLVVIGPSGAGKSTPLRALVGSRPSDGGEVRYAGRDLYDDYDELRHRIALVAQDDVLHIQLAVAAVLGYAARLRFPTDTTPQDREARVAEVLEQLGLTPARHTTDRDGGSRRNSRSRSPRTCRKGSCAGEPLVRVLGHCTGDDRVQSHGNAWNDLRMARRRSVQVGADDAGIPSTANGRRPVSASNNRQPSA